MKPQDRERIQVEVVSRVVGRYLSGGKGESVAALEGVINDTLYHERRRLEREGNDSRARADRAFYASVQRRLSRVSTSELRGIVEQMAQRFVGEVVGNFDQRVYNLSTQVLPAALSALLSALSPSKLLSLDALRSGLAQHIVLQGELDHVRRLASCSRLVLVPTHSSNLDSIIIGYAIYLLGLPPMLYGAGINLFTNPLISYFMRNLGAYRVDRRKTTSFYKDILKEYATCSMEMGYHNIFFPGGTRSRDGAVETRLKKGLLGCALQAYVNNLLADRDNPRLCIVPCTLSYKLVLEAETLIDDHLKEVGKSRYIITDDEFSKPRRVLQFMTKLMSLDSRIIVTFSRPLDLFGNFVDEDGRSVDRHGRTIDERRYVLCSGVPVQDAQRDHQYTNEVSEEIAKQYLRDNVVQSTNLVSYALLNLMKRANPGIDPYRLLRTGGNQPSFPMREMHQETDNVLAQLRAHPSGPRLGEEVARGDVQAIVADGLKHFSIYHSKQAAYRRGDRIFHQDRNLLLFYGNRLRGYGLDRRIAVAK